MSFVLTCSGVFIAMTTLLADFFLIVYLLVHAHLIFPFRNGFKEGEAEVVRYIESYSNDGTDPPSYKPVLKYYNAYQQKTIEKEIDNSGIHSPESKALFPGKRERIVPVRTIVAVQYTEKAVRITDERYIPHKRYNLMHYIRPIILCTVCGVVGAVMTIVGIMMG